MELTKKFASGMPHLCPADGACVAKGYLKRRASTLWRIEPRRQLKTVGLRRARAAICSSNFGMLFRQN